MTDNGTRKPNEPSLSKLTTSYAPGTPAALIERALARVGQRPVLVLDSGVGGLTVVRAIRAALPALRLRYLADNAGFPYGAQPAPVLAERVCELVATARSQFGVAAVVVACNTASTTVLDALRQRFAGLDPLPIVGVVPAIKPAGALSRTRHVALLATAATVQRQYIDELAARFAPDCRITRIGDPVLASLAEAKVRGESVDTAVLREILAPLHERDEAPIDTVILGCTHYPLLLEELQAVAPPGLHWLDPAPAVARRLADVLAGLPPTVSAGEATVCADTAHFTAPLQGGSRAAAALRRFLAQQGFAQVADWPCGESAALGRAPA